MTFYSVTVHREFDDYTFLPMSAERFNRWLERVGTANFSVITATSDAKPFKARPVKKATARIKRVGISRVRSRGTHIQQQLHEREGTIEPDSGSK